MSVGAATGGARQQVYHQSPSDCIENLRAVTPSLLLLQVRVADNVGFSEQMWSLRTDGTGQHLLTSLATDPAAALAFSLNQTTQFPWSNVSRDNGTYAVWADYPTPAPGTQSILIGSLNGGPTTAIATTNPGTSTVSVAGWTTL